MNNRLYCIIETKKRELDSRIYLAIKSALSGWSVVIGKKSTLFNYSKFSKKGIFLFKSLGPKNLKNILRVKKNGHKAVALDEEGLTISNKEFVRKRIEKKCLDNIEFFFMWGEKQKKINAEQFNDYNEKLIPTGLSRMDILQNKFQNYIKYEATKINKKFGKFILLTTKFSKYNFPKNLKINEKLDNFKELNNIQAEIQHKNMIEYEKFLKNFSTNFKDHQIIVRPHPGEDANEWVKITKNYENVKTIIDDQSTCYWIMASEFLISCNCYTSLEAYLLNKISINYSPIKENIHDFELIKSVSYNINKQEKLDDLLKTYDADFIKFKNKTKIDKNLAEKIIKDYIHNYKKADSHDQILSYLSKIKVAEDRNYDLKSDKLNFTFLKILKKIKKYYHRILNLKNPGLVNLIKNKFPNLTKKELQNKLDNIIECLNIDNTNITIKEIYPEVFLIEKENFKN